MGILLFKVFVNFNLENHNEVYCELNAQWNPYLMIICGNGYFTAGEPDFWFRLQEQ
jgi:hypothetical protein